MQEIFCSWGFWIHTCANIQICFPKMLREARCRVAELVWRGSLSHYSLSARVKISKMQVKSNSWTAQRQTDGWGQATTNRWGEDEIYRPSRRKRETEMWRKCIYHMLRDSHVLTSALCSSATIFIALLAALLHTKSMGLVSASHISEATIQSRSSPGQTHKQANLFNL